MESEKVVFIVIDACIGVVTSLYWGKIVSCEAAIKEVELKGFEYFAICWLYAGEGALKDQRFS